MSNEEKAYIRGFVLGLWMQLHKLPQMKLAKKLFAKRHPEVWTLLNFDESEAKNG